MSDDKYSRFRARYTKKTTTGRTGGGRTGGGGGGGGGGSGSVKRPSGMTVGEYRDMLRKQAYAPGVGESTLGFTDVEQTERPPPEVGVDTSVTDVPSTFLESFPESRTEAGIREGRAYEQGLLENQIDFQQRQLEKDRQVAEMKARSFAESKESRDLALGSTVQFGPFGSGSRDPETLRTAKQYDERFREAQESQQKADASQYRLDLLKEAAAKGKTVAEAKQRLMDEMDEVDAQSRVLEEDIRLQSEARKEYGGIFSDQPNIYGKGGYRSRRNELAQRKRKINDMYNFLPETDEFVFGVEPLPESDVEKIDTPAAPVEMTDDEFLQQQMFSPPVSEVRFDEPSVVNRVDPVMVRSMQDELLKGGGVVIAEDTGQP